MLPRRGRAAAVDIFARFHMIHPYSDGNGRVSRVLMRGLCALADIPLAPRWTVAERPWGAAMGMALRAYPQTAFPLNFYFARYF
jgi:hypothetical protein